MKFYAGIGSRKTPANILQIMSNIGSFLATYNFTLRSGGAEGADKAFEQGVDVVSGPKEIFLPWKGFNNNPSQYYTVTEDAIEYASKFHPYWHNLNRPQKLLMARNCYQVLGTNLSQPVQFIICYTPNGKGTGGTGQALRIAKHINIPILDLGTPTNNINLLITNFLKNYV